MLRLLGIFLIATSTASCVGSTATPAKDGRAYVIVGSIFGSSMYVCDRDKGRPQCWEVLEEEAP